MFHCDRVQLMHRPEIETGSRQAQSSMNTGSGMNLGKLRAHMCHTCLAPFFTGLLLRPLSVAERPKTASGANHTRKEICADLKALH